MKVLFQKSSLHSLLFVDLERTKFSTKFNDFLFDTFDHYEMRQAQGSTITELHRKDF